MKPTINASEDSRVFQFIEFQDPETPSKWITRTVKLMRSIFGFALMDAAFDASENYVLLREESSDFIIKGNLAHLRWDGRQAEAQALPKQAWKGIERNRRVAYLSRFEKRVFRHRHPTLRRRLRTIIQELIYVPARILTDSNQLKLDLGRDLFGRAAYLELWARLARAA